MRTVLINLSVFFLVYIPLTGLLGIGGGFFVAHGMEREVSYSAFLWFVVALQLVVPTLFVFIVIYTIVHILARRRRSLRRWMSVWAIGLALSLTQAVLWGGLSLSLSWLVVTVAPAMLLGYLVRYPVASNST